MKQFTVCIFILLFFAKLGNGQPSHDKQDYINFIKKFYYHLLDDDTVTVREFVELFDFSTIEYEVYLFNLICDENPNHKICKERGINSLANEWGNYSSIFFAELRSNKNRFTQSYDERIDSIIDNCTKIYDEGSVGSIAFDVHFPNGKAIYFYLNRYPDEPINVTYIYLEDGVYHYAFFDRLIKKEDRGDPSSRNLKRLAIINDPDGYTNVREGKCSESSIVGKINKDEVFYFTPNYYTSWWKVRNRNGSIEGYMHKSRIVPFGTLPEEKKKELRSKYQE